MSEFQLCACGSAPGYPHRPDCPRPLYNPTDWQFEQWEKEWLAKTEQLNMKTQHTPTPWKAINHGPYIVKPGSDPNGSCGDSVIAITANNISRVRFIAEVGSLEDEANADFIVRACNCHEELLEACKTALPLLAKLLEASQGIDGIVDSRLNLEYDIEQVQTAIAKAQE